VSHGSYHFFVILGLEKDCFSKKNNDFSRPEDLASTEKIPDEGILMFFFEKQRIPSSGMTRERG